MKKIFNFIMIFSLSLSLFSMPVYAQEYNEQETIEEQLDENQIYATNTDINQYSSFETLKFDFGEQKENGYICVSASEKYDASQGYGFANTNAVENVTASGQGVLSDAVRFKADVPNHIFNVDLPVGVYKITVATGDVKSTTITAEGKQQLYFLTGSNASDSFTIPVTDGQLNIYPSSGAGDNNYSLCTLMIEQISTGTKTNPTIWIYGDSTVCNYYNVDDNHAHGWGQLLCKYVDTDKYDIRNLAINGMSAKKLVGHDSFGLSEYYGKNGDILLISIGINDYIEDTRNNNDSSAYVAAMTDMVKRAKAKGMTVYLVKQQGLLNDHQKYPVIKYQWYGKEVESIAKAENVNLIDLFQPWLEMCLEKTYYGVPAYYQTHSDGSKNEIHPNAIGADILAKTAAEQIFPSPKQEQEDNSDMYDDQFSSESTVVYQTEVFKGPISNPHKGFVMEVTDPSQFEPTYRYGIGGSYDNHAWDVVSVCYDVLFWKDLNPKEGVYKWDDIDDMLEACEKHGMTYGIRILPYSTGAGSDDNYGATHNFVPQWVFDKGAKMDIATYKHGDPSVKIKIPNWSDPIYIKAYKDFISALAERYDGDTRVEFVEIRAFGNFGEWHTSQFVGNDMPSIEIQKDMIKHFADVFKNTMSCALSDVKGEVYDYALSIGVTKRNDGLIMTPNEEWDLRPVYRANYPVLGDYHHQYKYMKNLPEDNPGHYLPWTETRFRETIEIPHLSMLSIDMDSTFGYDIYRENKDLIDEMSHRIGYNFMVTTAKRNGNKLLVKIKNTGLAPAFFDINLCAELTDSNGNKIADFGEPIKIEKGTFRDGATFAYVFEYDGTITEDASICIAMYESDKSKDKYKDPTVKFDNKNSFSNNRLKLGDVKAEELKPNNQVTLEAQGIYGLVADNKHFVCGMVVDSSDKSSIEYSWWACKDDGKSWIKIKDWTLANEWLDWTPEEYGDYVVVGKARVIGQPDTEVAASTYYFYHPYIKGICQLPYEGEGGGYLIGIESYEYTGPEYTYEMLILDCTLLAQGKDAWVYTTNKCKGANNCLWTIWQPQYGYYWTLFRIYDENGNLVDEQCYGFQNI